MRTLAAMAPILLFTTLIGCKTNPSSPSQLDQQAQQAQQPDPTASAPSEPMTTLEVFWFNIEAYPSYKFRIGDPEPGCDARHVHSDDPVASIGWRDSEGMHFCDSCFVEKDDPAPRGCGHGKVSEMETELIAVPQSVFDDYVELFGGP